MWEHKISNRSFSYKEAPQVIQKLVTLLFLAGAEQFDLTEYPLLEDTCIKR
jgi:hypothetical protein